MSASLGVRRLRITHRGPPCMSVQETAQLSGHKLETGWSFVDSWRKSFPSCVRMLWIGPARQPGRTGKPLGKCDSSTQVGTEVLNVGGWLTYGDAALDAGCDILLITEARLVTARSRNKCAELRWKKRTSVWSLVCQDTSHVGAEGLGQISLRGAAFSLLSTPELKRYWHTGRAVRVILPTGSGRLCQYTGGLWFQGAEKDLNTLALAELLFLAVFSDNRVLGNVQHILLAGDSNVLHSKLRWVELESDFAGQGLDTCKMYWTSEGTRMDFLVACTLPRKVVQAMFLRQNVAEHWFVGRSGHPGCCVHPRLAWSGASQ